MELGTESQLSEEYTDPYSTLPIPKCPVNIHPLQSKKKQGFIYS